MKFKLRPEDFIVEEVLKENVIKEKGKYKVFKAKKVNLETFYIKNLIERAFKTKVSFAGLKDKKSVSYVYFSTTKEVPNYIALNNFKAECVGFSDSELKGSDIEKNIFKITLREVKKEEIEKIERILEDLRENGFINYFDTQRTSYEKKGFFFEQIFKGDLKEGIKIHLLSISPEGKKNLRRFKKLVLKYFDDPERLLPYAPSDEEKEILKKMLKGRYESIIKGIKKSILKMYFEKFSSFIWNKAVIKFLKRKKISEKKGFTIKTPHLYLFFPFKIEEGFRQILSSPLFPVPGTDKTAIHPEFEAILKKILRSYGMDYPVKMPSIFEGLNIRSSKRKILVFPEDFDYFFENDKLYLNFSLPPGSYATILLKVLIRRLNIRP